MKKILRNKTLVISLAIIVLVFGGLIIAWLSSLYTLEHMSFRNVAPTQMASAMRQDEFWSTYRFNTLVFEGTVKAITLQNGNAVLAFETSDAYGVSCELPSQTQNFKVGQTYKFGVESYQAERQPHGVLLRNCESL